MTKKKKMILGVLGLVAVLFVTLIVVASVLITPERVRQTVVPLAEDALGRKVELGEIKASIFSGISLQDMAVLQKSGQGTFVSAEKVVLRYSLMALLMFRVEVDEITLVKPRIEIVRNKDGSYNFSDLTETDKPKSASDDTSVVTDNGSIDLLISAISISDGLLLYVDNSVKGKPERHEVANFNLTATDVSTSQEFPVDLSADWNGHAIGLNGKVNLRESGVEVETRFNKLKMAVSGSMKSGKLKATLKLPETSFADIDVSVPKEYSPDLTGQNFQGSVKVDINIDDDVLEASGLVVKVNEQVVRAELGVQNLYGQPVQVDFKVTSDSFVVDKLIQADTRVVSESEASRVEPAPSEVGPFDIPLLMNGEVRIGKAVYNGIPLNDLLLKVSLKENILRIENLQAAIAGGLFKKRGRVNLGVKGLTYSTEIELKGVQGNEMVQLVKPELAESVQGLLGGELQLSGGGTLPETIKKKLSGKGSLRLANGKLQSIPALDATAALLDVGELREIVLDDGHINFTVKDGQLNLNSKINGPKTRFVTDGQVSLDGKLNLRSQLALSPELGGRLHEKGKLARYLGDEQGWTTVPLRIKGSYDGPDVGLDSKGLKKQAEKAVKKEVQKSLEKELQRGLKKLFGN